MLTHSGLFVIFSETQNRSEGARIRHTIFSKVVVDKIIEAVDNLHGLVSEAVLLSVRTLAHCWSASVWNSL